MKSNKVLRNSLIFIALVAMAYIGFTTVLKQDLTEQLKQNPLHLDAPIIQQSLGTSCGEAAIAIAYNYANPQAPISEAEAIDYATTQGYFTAGVPPYTSPVNMVKIAEYYADEVSSGTVGSPEQGLSVLVENLQDDTPVIIDVLTILTDPQSEAHFVVVTGISVDPSQENGFIIHYNDPFTGTQESAAWAGETGIWNAWQNNGDPGGPGWWLAIPPQ